MQDGHHVGTASCDSHLLVSIVKADGKSCCVPAYLQDFDCRARGVARITSFYGAIILFAEDCVDDFGYCIGPVLTVESSFGAWRDGWF